MSDRSEADHPSRAPKSSSEASTEPDFDRDIHIASCATDGLGRNQPVGSGGPVTYMYAYIGVAMLAILAAQAAIRLMPMSPPMTRLAIFALWVGLGVPVLFVALRHGWQRLRHNIVFRPNTWRSDRRYRVRFVGSREDFVRLGPIEDEAFEPIVIYGFMAGGLNRAQIWVWTASSVLAIYPCMLLFDLAGLTPLRLSLFNIAAIVAAGFVTTSFLWPTYLRVSPDTLEIVRYPLLGRADASIRRLDLRTSEVQVRWPGSIRIERSADEDSERARPLLISPPFPWDRKRFIVAVLKASISTAPAPELSAASL